jgi:hypothetical protein
MLPGITNTLLVRLVPPKNGLEPLQFFEPLNGVIFTTSTKKVLNTNLIYTTHMAMMFLAMWSNFTMLHKTQILDVSVMIITLEVGTSPILHLLILTPLSRASNFMLPFQAGLFSMIARYLDNSLPVIYRAINCTLRYSTSTTSNS